MKKFLSLLLAVMLLAGCFSANVFAEETVYPKVIHSYTTTEDYASDEWSTAQRGAYLLNGRSSISRPDNTHINISGNTNATQTCDKIILVLYVQQTLWQLALLHVALSGRVRRSSTSSSLMRKHC